ncbi:MAG: LysR family transcriptional regulator [Leptolyngbya sp. SIO3F4]|nr:LysR family transcriptional regulator [Leptolyngbya sp. SIO3F4]
MGIWDGVSEFVTVVDAGSFSAAAKRLGVSTSYVSRQVAALEARLGIRLLARSTRRVRMTDAGTEYYRRCAELVSGLEEANQVVIGETAEVVGRIRVAVAGAFAERYVAPALAEFARQHPQVQIDLNFNTRNINLIDEGFDFAIRYGLLEDSSLIARKLTSRTLVACASPDYLQTWGTPVEPDDLRDHACLRTNTDRWRFSYPDGERFVRVSGPWRSNNGPALAAAAVMGLGIAYSPQVNLIEALEAGQLVPILQDFWDRDRATWIVYPERRHQPLRVRRAIDFLVEYFRKQEDSLAV